MITVKNGAPQYTTNASAAFYVLWKAAQHARRVRCDCRNILIESEAAQRLGPHPSAVAVGDHHTIHVDRTPDRPTFGHWLCPHLRWLGCIK